MLELTVLQRYSDKAGSRFCDILGIFEIDFDSRKILGCKSTEILNCKYVDLKEIICNLFTSDLTKKEIFQEIRKNGMKITETKFADREDQEIAILIED